MASQVVSAKRAYDEKLKRTVDSGIDYDLTTKECIDNKDREVSDNVCHRAVALTRAAE